MSQTTPSETALQPLENHQSSIRIFNKKDPRALINIVWDSFAEILLVIEEKYQAFMYLNERELKKKLDPDPMSCRLRLRFWDEFAVAQDKGRRMYLRNIVSGVCSEDAWEVNYQRDAKKCLWLITPPVDYVISMQELLYLGLEEFRGILELPIVSELTGKVDTKLIAEKVKIVQMLELRVKGAVIQKLAIQQRIDQTIEHRERNDPLVLASDADIEAIDAQIRAVTRSIEKIQKKEILLPTSSGGSGETIDVTSANDGIEEGVIVEKS